MIMKVSLIILGCVLATAQAAHVRSASSSNNNNNYNYNIHSNTDRQIRRHLLEPGFECTLYVKATLFEDGHGEESLSCELSPGTMAAMAAASGDNNSNGIGIGMSDIIDVVGVRRESIDENGIVFVSGESIMRLNEGYIEQGSGANNYGDVQLVVSSSADVEFVKLSENDTRHFRNRHRSRQRGRNLAKSTGTLRTLVVRVEDGNGAEPTASQAQLRDDIFTDKVSLKTHYAACSNDKINIQEQGIVDVKIDTIAQSDGSNKSALEKAARAVVTKEYGNLSANYDLVMFCLPLMGSWVAYAYINGRDSVYNNNWCRQISAQMHEIGHNLGLAHSGKGTNEYGDKSSMMGYSYSSDDGPKMCFNAAKNYQLDWYDNQKATYNPLDNLNNPQTTFVLNGVDDAQKNGQSNKLITLRLQENGVGDYYVGYNRATGVNSGTLHAKNQVAIFKKADGGPTGYGKSIRVAELSSNESVVVENWNGSIHDVTIRVVGDIGENIADAKIEVSVGGFFPTEAPAKPPTKAPTEAPQAKPPTKAPTESPTKKDDCFDDLSYRFRSAKPCQWIAQDAAKRCNFEWEDKLVKESCRKTCNFCDDVTPVPPTVAPAKSPTKAPTTPPTESPTKKDDCFDDLSYKYRSAKPCQWIAQDTAKRCNFEWEGKFVKESCRKTCNFCNDVTPVPPTPTTPPTKKDDCFDDLSYRYRSVKACEWIAQNAAKRCNLEWEGTLVEESCRETCNFCGDETREPPTVAPAPDDCVNSKAFALGDNPKKNCKWVGKGKNKKVKRNCRKQYEGIKVLDWCPVTCGKVGLGACTQAIII